jgi:hypothetical protein
METTMRISIATLIVLVIGSSLPAAENPLTYLDLVKRVTDLEYLATLPAQGETCAQWSSYDRASKYDAAGGKYINWDANGDGGGYIRKEGESFVMAEMDGPGCIWRIWSARPQNGHVRIYLDGAAEPVVDLPFVGYFDHKNEPFTGKALVHNVANGENNYVPIPYGKSCKIVADKGWGQYFHFTYGTFPKGTQVPTFKRQLSAEESAALAAADKALSESGPDPVMNRPGQATESKNVTIAAGQSVTVTTLAGPRAITDLRVKLDLPKSPDDRIALRELVLKITWDDDAAPAVWVPLGDFFGTAAGGNKYRSLTLGLTDDGTWYSHWYMPFGKSAKVELVNDGKAQRAVAFEITHAPLTRPIDTLARLHVKWHRDVFLPAEKERQIDWPMLVTEGRGRFVGVMLHVWSPKGGWWGEGDEKFFVDGEKFPSTFGTGSEDYFGYAWSSPKLFQHAFHNQTISQNLKGHISVNRWQIADNVPFQKSFEADIEKYYPNKRPCLYAAVAYWYLAPGVNDGYQPASLEERTGYWEIPPSARIPGALEAEEMKILGKTGGNAGSQEMSYSTGNWSDDKQLWWTGAKPGDKLDLALPVAKAGQQKLILQLTKARDYGIVQVSLDGQKLGNPIDLYSPQVVPFGPVSLGPVDLSAGEHKLTFEITGANEKALKAYMVGIDYVKLDPQ